MKAKDIAPLKAAALAAGAERIEVDTCHAHARLILHYLGRSRFVVIGSTNSDHRAQKNNVKWIKKMMAELKA